MPDLNHQWSGDLAVSARGDLATVDGLTRGQQRIIRRLMTNLKAYIWHLDYGASVPARIGGPLDLTLIQAVIRSQIFLEAAVARNPQPQIIVEPILNGVFARIIYEDNESGQQITLQFDVSP